MNQSLRSRLPRLELQLMQQMATVAGLSHGGLLIEVFDRCPVDSGPADPDGIICLWQ